MGGDTKMREEMIVQLRDKKLVYEECSADEFFRSKHTFVMYLNGNPIKHFKLKEVKELVVT